MKQLLIVFFIFYLLKAPSQSVDSLRSTAHHTDHDTSMVVLFYNEGFANRFSNPQYSYDCAVEAENYAQKGDQPYYLAKVNDLLGLLYLRKGDLTNALVFHKKALAMRMLINDNSGIATSQVYIGDILAGMKLNDLSQAAYLEAIAKGYETGQQKEMGDCLLKLALMNADLKNVNAAENYFNAGLANARKRGNNSDGKELEAACLNGLAALDIMKKDFEGAINYALGSIKIKPSAGNEKEKAYSYLALADAYMQKHDLPKASSYLNTADSLIAKYDYFQARLQALSKRAEYYELSKNFDAAYSTLKNYNVLKDSLEKSNEFLKTQNNFIERRIVQQAQEKRNAGFPYLMLITLCLIALGCISFSVRHRR